MQVDPIKPKLKPPGTKRLKPNCDTLLSTTACKLNLRRYTEEYVRFLTNILETVEKKYAGFELPPDLAAQFRAEWGARVEAGAYTRPLLGST